MENIQITKKKCSKSITGGMGEKYGFNNEKYFVMSLKNSTYIYGEYPKSLKKCSKSITGGMGKRMVLIMKILCNEPEKFNIYIWRISK